MIFLDSCALIGYLLKRDKHHKRMKYLIDVELEYEKKMINNTVIIEVVNSISPRDQVKISEIMEKLLNIDFIDYLDVNDYIEAANIYQHYGRKIGYPDCTMIRTMMKHQFNNIVTVDSHFEKTGGYNIIR